MLALIYLFIIGGLATANAQTSVGSTTCPWGSLQVGTYSDGTPVCDECTPDAASCNEWFNCPITQDPRCNMRNCTTYICNSDEELVHERFCASALPPGQYTVCQGSDVFMPSAGMCVNYYVPSADGCIEPDRPYTSEDGTLKCMRMYPPHMQACPVGYYMHNEGSETVCFTVRPAECSNSTVEFSESASVTPRPKEPTMTATASTKPEEPTMTATVSSKPQEPTQTARPVEPSSTPTMTPRPQEPTQTAKPVEPSSTPTMTPRPQEPTQTAKPEDPSRTSTPTVKPSTTATRTPRRSSTSTMTPKEQVEEPSRTSTPSAKPLPPRDICEQDPRNPRCVKPDSILNQFAVDATIAPLPTFKPAAKPFKPMTVAPTPTPWAVPQDVVIPPEVIPPYMPSRVSFTDGNPTQFEEPQKVQEIQASIACTLRMPLEKIRVENITILTISTGERTKVAVDPSDFMMESNGTVVCYEVASSARLLRALQSTDIQVDVDYLIVKPTADILALNTSQFAEIIRTSPVIQTLAQSVGSTGVAAEVTVASYAGIQSAAAAPISPSSQMQFPTYGIGILGGGGGLIVFASLGVGYYMYKRKQKKIKSPLQTTSPAAVRVVSFVPENGQFSLNTPTQVPRPSILGRGQSTRTHFNPLRVSTGAADISQAV